MLQTPLTLLTLALLVAPSPPAEAAGSASYALIVTNNRSLSTGRPNLHYADDDGAKYAQLFADMWGPERVTLLTGFDDQSRLLYPGWVDVARPPTLFELSTAVATLAARLEEDRRAGRKTSVTLVLAAHGDIDGGQGFIELEDGRLTARSLDRDVIAALPADRLHLIVDSCNSYFMLNPRKPGGRSWKADPARGASLLARHPHVGAMISTTAEAVTYEWSEIQSGIFSHEVRSGLRGAADANTDGLISYAELAAFVVTANADLVNDLYRPRVYARGPAGELSASILALPGLARRLSVGSTQRRRVSVRDARGVRIADLHTEPGAESHLVLPPGALTIHETIARQGDAPVVVLRELAEGVSESIDRIASAAPSVAGRGSSPVFDDLFRTPFGPAALASFEASDYPLEGAHYGVTRQDVRRLADHLRAAASFGGQERRQAGLGIGSVGVALFAGALVFLADGRHAASADVLVPLGVGVGLTSWGVYLLASTTAGEDLAASLERREFSTEEERARFVLRAESQLAEIVLEQKAARTREGVAQLVSGLGSLAGGVAGLVASESSAGDVGGLFLIVGGGYAAGSGLLTLLFSRTPEERVWELYEKDPTFDQRLGPAPAAGAASIRPGFGLTAEGEPTLTLSGRW